MYKKIILFTALFATLGLSSNAQFLDLSNNSEHASVAFTIGKAGFGTEYGGLGIGGSLSICGFYVDCLINSPEHLYDKHMYSADSPNRYIPDSRAFTVNFGYQIPVLSWLRIAPIIGYSQTSYGVVDRSSMNIEVDSESSTGRVRHDYISSEDFDEFNFGGAIFIQPIPFIEIGFVGTRRAIYGSIGFSLDSFSSED